MSTVVITTNQCATVIAAVEDMIADVKMELREKRDPGKSEDFLDYGRGRLSAFEDVLRILKGNP